MKPASSGKTGKSYQKGRIKKKNKIYFIYVTFGSLNEAKRLAHGEIDKTITYGRIYL